jgi:mono/diheme cytochrome c family protein
VTLVASGLFAAAAVLPVAATPVAQGTASVLDGAYTEAQATRGELIYFENCAACHGPALEGGDMTPGLTGAVFLANWNDLTLGDLSERIRTSMPLDRPGKLSRQQTADVIAFVLKANRWPAGDRELPTDTPSQKQIKIESLRR